MTTRGLPSFRLHDLRHSFASHAGFYHDPAMPILTIGMSSRQRSGDQIEQNISGSYSLSRNTKYDSVPLPHD